MERRGDDPRAILALYFRAHGGEAELLQEYTKLPGRGISVSADKRWVATSKLTPPISDLFLLESAR